VLSAVTDRYATNGQTWRCEQTSTCLRVDQSVVGSRKCGYCSFGLGRFAVSDADVAGAKLTGSQRGSFQGGL